MPRQPVAPAAPAPSTSTALATSQLSPEMMQALLREQRAEITTQRRLPSIKVMGAAACLFEFEDTNETKRSFEAVILRTHQRGVMFDKPYGEEAASEEEAKPACGSYDGVNGLPRKDFVHAQLGRAATGQELVACGSCRYNRFGSAGLLNLPNKNPRGKACTNQRSIYVLVDDRAAPMELVIAPSSIAALEEYLATLTNHGVPLLAVRTKFSQEKKERGSMKWAVVSFARGDNLTAEEMEHVMSIRAEYHAVMHPVTRPREDESNIPEGTVTASGDVAAAGEASDDLPF